MIERDLFCKRDTMEKIVMYSDGGSRGNPGSSALGVYIETLDKKYGEFLGTKTNNEAEYLAIIFGLKKIKSLIGKVKAKQTVIECRMDSELACKQLNHEYKIENEKLQPHFLEIWNLMLDFSEVKFIHVGREYNTVADACANEAMDNAEKKKQLF
ncbi:MAG: hypothetical protein CO143_03035 [Candidatus Moranbacteria bacterium CG_4_9_14_3_um_filter_45_14]|nr:MAG: hypothetical protein AUK19_00600 [Candidatus Moranbacteria bacterium CG2_30_45_14]PJA85107.1 MAG: hypothetical protein CO143_03035 [Candidatus Moranbacteria bacterium CG_4_9_14_3_um_filter_45_14]